MELSEKYTPPVLRVSITLEKDLHNMSQKGSFMGLILTCFWWSDKGGFEVVRK
jgi:hypothetical protein